MPLCSSDDQWVVAKVSAGISNFVWVPAAVAILYMSLSGYARSKPGCVQWIDCHFQTLRNVWPVLGKS